MHSTGARRTRVPVQYVVMLCQASCFIGVEYHTSTHAQSKIRLPRLTPHFIRYQEFKTVPVPIAVMLRQLLPHAITTASQAVTP